MKEKLREHQVAPFEQLVAIQKRRKTAVDKSGTGTGKTYVAAAAAIASGLPTLVVHPKVARSAWSRAADLFGEKFSQVGYEMLRTGNTDFGKWTGGAGKREVYYQCQCCQRVVNLDALEPCYVHSQGIHCIERKTKQHNYGQFVFHPGVKQIIFDEAHRCGGMDSLNADMMIAAKRQGLNVLALSATLASGPLQMRALGYLLDLHNLDHDLILTGGLPLLKATKLKPSFWRWASHYGCRRDNRFRGWKWFVTEREQREVMLQIHQQIVPERGVRVRCEDIPGFPKCDIQPELYDVSSPERVNELYEQVAEALELLKAHAGDDKAPDHPLTRILRARQELELLKVPIAEELGGDYMEKGFSVVFFVNFRQTIDELAKRFPDALIIDGSPDSVKHRMESLSKFQENSCRNLIVNNSAGAESLSMQDLDGEHPRVGLVMPCHSAVTIQQVFGRLPRDGGKSVAHYRVLLADHTVERALHRSLRAKLNNLETLNDGDLNPSNLIIRAG